MADTSLRPGLQLSWVDGQAMAWQPDRGTGGGNLHSEISRIAHRRNLPYSGQTALVRMVLPDSQVSTMCQRVDVSTLAALARLDLRPTAVAHDVSPSIAWFATVQRVVQSMAVRGRVLPVLTHLTTNAAGSHWVAEWKPLVDDVERTRPLLDAMPPVVAAAGEFDRVDMLHLLVDRYCRATLLSQGWNPLTSDQRSVPARALRAVSRALVAEHGQFTVSAELQPSLASLASELGTVERRATGEPIVEVRLRLALPDPLELDGESDELPFRLIDDDPGTTAPGGIGDWPLALELVSVDDRSRFCTADDLHRRNAAALSIAGDERFLDLLQQQLHRAAVAIGAAVPSLAGWLSGPHHGVSVDVAADTLAAVDALALAGIDLIAPEKLVRRRPSTRATALPTDNANNSSGRLATNTLLEWNVVIDDTPVSDEVLRRAAESGANLIDVGGRWVQIDRAEAQRALANLQRHRTEHGEVGALQLLTLAAELQRELDAYGLDEAVNGSGSANGDGPAPITSITASGWAHQLLNGLPDDALGEGVVPEGFTATLRHYQLRGLGWLQFLRRLGLSGCLADDMGLGKTPTTLAHLAALPGPHLVVCPLSVVRNWEAEAARFAPFMRVHVHHGTGRATDDEFVARAVAHDLVVTTYQVAARDLDAFQRVPWSTVVLDEAQAIKNPDTRTARAMRGIAATQHIALTGTPVENRLQELWSIFQVVAPGLLGSANQFRQRFANPIEKDHDTAATLELRRLTAPFLLRRSKADPNLVPDLPEKVEQIAWAPLTREQAHMYQAVVDQLMADAQQTSGMKRRGLVLAALTRLKQICNHPAHALADGSKLAGRSGKLQRFDELVTDLHDAGEQALVFTQFREMGLLLQQHLHERFGQHVPFLHGGVSKAHRDRMVEQFQAGTSGSPLLLVSLRAGGTGLNLTAASRVIHYDRWWNPAVEDQATDRAYRIGQTQSVFVHKMVCEGTIEERIDALINDKRSLANTVVGTTGENWLTELSTDALRDLVTLDHSKVRTP